MTDGSSTSLQPNISNVPKKDANGKPIPNTSDGTLVRIRLFDDRERVLFFKENPSPTAKQVCDMVIQKLDLQPESASVFSLWIVGKDLELQIRPKLELLDMTAKWPRYLEKYTHSNDIYSAQSATSYKFVFKREAMFSVKQEREIKDEVAIKLLFGEARNNVFAGRYPFSSADEFAKVTGLVLFITYGDYNEAKHGVGTNFISAVLKNIVPKYLIGKLKAAEWESKLIGSWAPNNGKKGIMPYKEYLEEFYQFPWYGSTFFPACKNVPPQGYFELRTDHLLIAVNCDNICILDEDRHKLLWSGTYEGVEWECTPDSITVEYMPKASKDGQPPKKASSVLITPQAHLVDSLAARAIYLIEKAEKSKRGMTLKSHPNSGAGRGNTLKPNKERRGSLQPPAPAGADPSVKDRRSSKVYGDERPPSPTVDMPGRIPSVAEESEEAVNYLNAVAAIRKNSK